jgi:hypothetical protein
MSTSEEECNARLAAEIAARETTRAELDAMSAERDTWKAHAGWAWGEFNNVSAALGGTQNQLEQAMWQVGQLTEGIEKVMEGKASLEDLAGFFNRPKPPGVHPANEIGWAIYNDSGYVLFATIRQRRTEAIAAYNALDTSADWSKDRKRERLRCVRLVIVPEPILLRREPPMPMDRIVPKA